MYICYSNFSFPSMPSKKSSTHWSLEVSCRCRCSVGSNCPCPCSWLPLLQELQMQQVPNIWNILQTHVNHAIANCAIFRQTEMT